MYLAFNPACSEDLVTATSRVEACVAEIRSWMSLNYLKLNDDNSELLVLHTKHSPRPNISNIMVGEDGITQLHVVILVLCLRLTFKTHINSMCRTSFWHLKNTWRIRTYLDKSSLEILIRAFVTNKLDYCNSLLTGLPRYQIKRL